MITIKNKSKCSGCYACSAVCPKHCITMKADSEGFFYPEADKNICINCNLCEKVCPILNPYVKREQKPQAYAAYSKDIEVRMQSSSGGIFTLIAEHIIKQGGVVFGAAFNDCFEVEHIAIDDIAKLYQLRGSKYVQSKIGASYEHVKVFLDSGRLVLFTGTPCQIGGLKAYLKHDYNNLFCQDIICHGVPSPMVWQKYIQYREADAVSKTRRTFFRDKRFGWKTFSLLFEFSNNKEYIKIHKVDFYMKAFLRNLSLRPSCYNCAFKTINRQSDITLADFWGIQHIAPHMDDDKGTSLVFINSNKGDALFDAIKSKLVYQDVDGLEAVKYNSAMTNSVNKPKQRELFFETIHTNTFKKAIKKCCKDSIFFKIIRKLKSKF